MTDDQVPDDTAMACPGTSAPLAKGGARVHHHLVQCGGTDGHTVRFARCTPDGHVCPMHDDTWPHRQVPGPADPKAYRRRIYADDPWVDALMPEVKK